MSNQPDPLDELALSLMYAYGVPTVNPKLWIPHRPSPRQSLFLQCDVQDVELAKPASLTMFRHAFRYALRYALRIVSAATRFSQVTNHLLHAFLGGPTVGPT